VAKIFKATPKSTIIGQKIQVKITRLDFNGCGVGSYQKKSVFIDGTLPNETVVAKIIEQKSKYYRGKLLDVINSSDKRVIAQCQHFLKCGGCDVQHISPQEQLLMKQKKVSELFSRQHILSLNDEADLPWQESLFSQPYHYRRKARIGVQYDKKGQVTIGFRQRGSNLLVGIRKCPVLLEPLSEFFQPLKLLLAKLSGKNPIGHIEIIATDVVTLIIRQLVKLSPQDKVLWSNFSSEVNCQIMVDNGEQVLSLSTCQPLSYSLVNANHQPIKISFSADDFIQVNADINNKMVAQAIDWLSLNEHDQVLDLFCGLGNFSLAIASIVAKVTGIEGVDKMVIKARENAIENNLTNCQFYQADLNSDWQSNAWAKEKYTKVLLDPARAGAYQAIEQLVKFNIEQILYISCDPATLAKDTALLLTHGYKIEKIALMDMFTHTKHIETMVLFVRDSSSSH